AVSALAAKSDTSTVTAMQSQVTGIANAQASGRLHFSSYAAMVADESQDTGTIAEVGAVESDADLRGVYQWDGSDWVFDENAVSGRVGTLETTATRQGEAVASERKLVEEIDTIPLM